jgi:hypothetical protein
LDIAHFPVGLCLVGTSLGLYAVQKVRPVGLGKVQLWGCGAIRQGLVLSSVCGLSISLLHGRSWLSMSEKVKKAVRRAVGLRGAIVEL